MEILCLEKLPGLEKMSIRLEGLCEKCINEKCRKWLIRNMDGIKGRLIVENCEFFVPEKEEPK